MKKSVCVIVSAAAFAVAGVLASSAAASLSPQRLYTKLLTTVYPDSQLPADFSSAKVSLYPLSSNAKKHKAVGEADVAVDGPDPDDGIEFLVFPNHADAVADLNHPTFSGSVKLSIVPGGVPGYTKLPGHMWAGSITGKNALGKTITNGVTFVAVAQANVLVAAYTDSADTTASGNIPAALTLLKSALRHLAKVSA